MVTIQGQLLGPRLVELFEAVPRGEESIQVLLVIPPRLEACDAGPLTHHSAFGFLWDEPDLYG